MELCMMCTYLCTWRHLYTCITVPGTCHLGGSMLPSYRGYFNRNCSYDSCSHSHRRVVIILGHGYLLHWLLHRLLHRLYWVYWLNYRLYRLHRLHRGLRVRVFLARCIDSEHSPLQWRMSRFSLRSHLNSTTLHSTARSFLCRLSSSPTP